MCNIKGYLYKTLKMLQSIVAQSVEYFPKHFFKESNKNINKTILKYFELKFHFGKWEEKNKLENA